MTNNSIIDTIKARRSVRTYTQQQINEQDLLQIIEAGAYAPNGMHYETWHFTAIQNSDVLAEINDAVKIAFGRSDNPQLQERSKSNTYCCYYHAPTLVIVSNEPTQWWAPMDCACALQNMFLAAQSMGIASCWINQIGQTCNDPTVRPLLTRIGVPAHHNVYGCVALGYADPSVTLKEKVLKPGTLTLVR